MPNNIDTAGEESVTKICRIDVLSGERSRTVPAVTVFDPRSVSHHRTLHRAPTYSAAGSPRCTTNLQAN